MLGRASMPDEFNEETSQDAEQKERDRRWSEGVLRDTLRRAVEKGIEAGVGTLRSADSALRGVTQDGKLPKEVIGYVFASVDETKNAPFRSASGVAVWSRRSPSFRPKTCPSPDQHDRARQSLFGGCRPR